MATYINRKNGMKQSMTVEEFGKLPKAVQAKYRRATDAEEKTAAKASKQEVNKTSDDKTGK